MPALARRAPACEVGAHVSAGPEAPVRRWHESSSLVVGAVSVVVAALVAYPWTRRGYLVLLDWPSGSYSHIPRSFWGLDRGLTASMPFLVGVAAVERLLGSASHWLLIAAFFPIGGVGVA